MRVTESRAKAKLTGLVNSWQISHRLFIVLLIVIALASLVPRYIIGHTEPLSYNGYWDSFTSLQNRSTQWWLDVRDSGHPPLFFLLQHFAMKIGTSWLAMRSLVIVCGAATTFVMGLIADKLFQSKIFALLCATSLGFAMSLVELDTDVRPYPLALLLVTIAFLPFIDFIRDPQAPSAGKTLLSFTGLTLLAQLSEHFSLFFYCACIGSAAVYAAVYPEFRKSIWTFIKRKPVIVLIALILPPALFWTLSSIQLQYVTAVQPQVSDYYLATSGLAPWQYIRLNFSRELNYFLPIKINTVTQVTWIFAITPFLIYLLLAKGRRKSKLLSNLPIVVFVLLLLGLMAGGLASRYPLGGELRQQAIIAPFLTLSGFALLDRFSIGWFKIPVAVLVALWIAADFRTGWAHHSGPAEMFQTEYNTFQKEFPSSPVVFAGYFSCFGLYAATHTWNWRVDSSVIAAGSRIWVYKTVSPQGQHRLVLRDKDSWNLDFTQPGPYSVIANALRQTKLPSLDLFWAKQGGQVVSSAAAQKQTAQFAELANSAGLVIEAGHFDGRLGFFEFHLK
ncbi:MAG TPA: hypothetical protein VHZ07_00025 [Bryobacteraceae bacterium]|nr:hypothetical protein [Bryobacteraceae bacterium]